jgi:hypothetical protein
MRKLITISLTFLLITFGHSTKTYAATDGCPNAWTIDTSALNGYEQLLQAKEKLGVNMVLGEKEYFFSNYSGELGSMAKPGFQSFAISDLYLYGKTDVAFKVSVQVKDCPGVREFTFNKGKLLDIFKFSTPLVRDTAKNWAERNEKLFGDFLSARNFATCISNAESRVKKLALESNNPPGSVLYQYIDPRYNIRPSLRCGQIANLILLNLSPDSELFFSGDNFKRYGIQVLPNKTSLFAFAVYAGIWYPTQGGLYDSPGSRSQEVLTIFDTFSVTGKSTKNSITCIKGKTTKKVSGTSPKCPKGFKKTR